ncbi:MAG: methyltransferase [Lentisphaerae bacterium GWF2_45_14]|nr:MAG: methyltransferase [Lentisphaerae bacterium GWF2_45_14]
MGALERLGIAGNSISGNKYSENQKQTEQTFSFKWEKRETYESEAVQENMKRWLFERYCDNDPGKLEKWLGHGPDRKIIVDAGCGAGHSGLIFFRDYLKLHDYLGVDISDAAYVAKKRFDEAGMPGDFLKENLQQLSIPDASVDMIFSEGVLHHTDNTGNSIRYLSKKLKKGGLFLFYVYRKKSVIREFTDDYIRNAISTMSDEDAWNAMYPLSKLGKTLGDLNLEIEIEDDIDCLGIPKGKINIQRLFYWHIFKAYYRPDFNLDEMNHINFDWYRPANCHRHTDEEVRGFCESAGLDIEHMNIQEAGITVVSRKH